MKITRSAGGVVLNLQGEVLVVSQNGNSWSLPKGHVQQGETDISAAVREIQEESGIKSLTYAKDLGTYKRYRIGLDGSDDRSELKEIIMFLFNSTQGDLRPTDPKNPEAVWLSKAKVLERLTHSKDKKFFKSIMNSF